MASEEKFRVGRNVHGVWNLDEFERVRKDPAIEALFHERGKEWVGKLNAELHAAQMKRKQPVEDGYVYHIHDRGTRTRMYIVAATARAQAHEKAHSSILKLMETTKYDVKLRKVLNRRAAARKAAATRRARKAAEAEEPTTGTRGIKTGMGVYRAASPDKRGRKGTS